MRVRCGKHARERTQACRQGLWLRGATAPPGLWAGSDPAPRPRTVAGSRGACLRGGPGVPAALLGRPEGWGGMHPGRGCPTLAASVRLLVPLSAGVAVADLTVLATSLAWTRVDRGGRVDSPRPELPISPSLGGRSRSRPRAKSDCQPPCGRVWRVVAARDRGGSSCGQWGARPQARRSGVRLVTFLWTPAWEVACLRGWWLREPAGLGGRGWGLWASSAFLGPCGEQLWAGGSGSLGPHPWAAGR